MQWLRTEEVTGFQKWIRALFTLIVLIPIPNLAAETFTFHHENVLGTSLELILDCGSAEQAKALEQIALEEIDRQNLVFSNYTAESELQKFNQMEVGQSMQASTELLVLLKRCEEWNQFSHGAFNPAIEMLSRRWRLAAQENRVPSTDELEKMIELLREPHWQINPQMNSITRLSSAALSLNAIAKGTILDSVCVQVEEQAKAQGVKLNGITLNIGGDVRTSGTLAQKVAIPSPKRDAIGGDLLDTVLLKDQAIATSGDSERFYTIEGKKYSHILNPATGRPNNETLCASVISNNAETADVLATICCVVPAPQALKIIEQIPNTSCLIYTLGGNVLTSTAWPSNQEGIGEQNGSKGSKAKAKTPYEFKLDFEIAKADEGRRYRRPYVAVWVEDKDGFPVKTLSLFIMAENPGPRWHRDLRRWYASDQVRLLVDETKLIGTISKPTRNPGEYKVAWDGTDDQGELLKEGEYTLYIEAAREHGTYQLIKQAFELGSTDFEHKLNGNVEIKEATFSYKKLKN